MADNEVDETISHENEWEVSKTAENEDGKEVIPRGNDWEVVSMTASTYAAAPGPRGDEYIHDDNDCAETSQALFLSGHFVFPPSEHENLPIVPEKLEIPKGAKEVDLVPQIDLLKEGKHENIDAKWGIEQDLYGSTKFGSSAVNDLVETSDHVIDASYTINHAPKSVKKDEDDDSELPCGAWWKRGVISLCAHAKETRSFWSIIVAAAVMGLVVLGQRWQQERRQILHQKWQLSVGDEKSVRILSRLKDVIIGGSRHTSYVTAASAEL